MAMATKFGLGAYRLVYIFVYIAANFRWRDKDSREGQAVSIAGVEWQIVVVQGFRYNS